MWDLYRGGRSTILVSGFSRCLDMSEDGKTAAISSAETIDVWNLEARTCLFSFPTRAEALALSHSGQLLISGNDAGQLQVWDLSARRLRDTFTPSEARVIDVAISVSGAKAASISEDRFLRIWDLEKGVDLYRVLCYPSRRVALSGDGKRVLCAMNNGVIRGWSTINGISLADLVGHKGAVLAISMNLDGTRAISTGEDRSLRLWNVNTGAPMRVFEGHTKRISATAMGSTERLAISWL